MCAVQCKLASLQSQAGEGRTSAFRVLQVPASALPKSTAMVFVFTLYLVPISFDASSRRDCVLEMSTMLIPVPLQANVRFSVVASFGRRSVQWIGPDHPGLSGL